MKIFSKLVLISAFALPISSVVMADEYNDLRASSANMTREEARKVDAGCPACVAVMAATRYGASQALRFGATTAERQLTREAFSRGIAYGVGSQVVSYTDTTSDRARQPEVTVSGQSQSQFMTSQGSLSTNFYNGVSKQGIPTAYYSNSSNQTVKFRFGK